MNKFPKLSSPNTNFPLQFLLLGKKEILHIHEKESVKEIFETLVKGRKATQKTVTLMRNNSPQENP